MRSGLIVLLRRVGIAVLLKRTDLPCLLTHRKHHSLWPARADAVRPMRLLIY